MLRKIFPFVAWFEGYDGASLRSDLIGGVTVALVLVPQSMAYAQLAGLPAYYGLYASFLPPMIASLFGSSRQLATGPVAVVSLMTSAALEPLATAGSEAYIGYAVLLALLVGVFQFLLGIFRLGAIINLLSHPVVNGFTTAAAIIIATSQLNKVFGVTVDKAPHHIETVVRVLEAAVHRTHWPTLVIAILAFATMIILKRINPRIPNVLVAVILTTVIASLFRLERVREVPVTAIAAPSVVALVDEYNVLVGQRESVENLRLTHASAVGEIEEGHTATCESCHEQRDLEVFGAAPRGDVVAGDAVVALHQMAGLLDRRLHEARLAESELREALREVTLVEAASDGASAVYGLRDEVPASRTMGRTAWRLRIGAGRVDPGAVTLSGGVAVVGRIPPGLPTPKVPTFDAAAALRLFPSAIIISVLGFMEAISIAKAIAARTKQRLDPNQELIGQGLSNLAGCMTQSYAVSGSFSRSAVNLAAGGRTGLSNVFSSAVVVIVLLVLSPTLYNLPQATLAAIIMMAVAGLINVDGFVHAWRAQRYDGIVSIATFVTTLVLAPHLEWGIALGMTLSMGGYIFRTMRPKVAELGFHPDGTLRDVQRHNLASCSKMAVIRFEGPLNFASATYLEDAILARVAQKRGLRHVVLAAGGINEIDASGEETLRRVLDRLHDGGIGFSVGGLNDVPMDVLRRTHLLDQIGEERLWPTPAQAVADAFDASHLDQDEERCPLRRLLLRISELSLHPDGALRNAEVHDLEQCRRIALLRFEGSLSFANTGALTEQVSDHLMGRPELNHVVLVFHTVSAVDTAAATRLCDVVRDLKGSGYGVALSGPSDDVLEALRAAGVIEEFGEEYIYGTQAAAISGIYARAHREGEEPGCPLRPVAPRLTEMVPDEGRGLREAGPGEDHLCRSMAVFRIEGPNALDYPDALAEEFRQWTTRHGAVGHVALIGHGIHHMDARIADRVVRLIGNLEALGAFAVMGRFSERVFSELKTTRAYAEMGVERLFEFQEDAVSAVVRRSRSREAGSDCPFARWLDQD
jgi:SulP family sulfate permease